MKQAEVLEILKETGALRTGHFRLSSGLHSGEYIEKFQVFRYPVKVQSLCRAIVKRFEDDEIEVVLGPTTGGILLAFEVARQMKIAALYAERADAPPPSGSRRELRRGQVLNPGTRVLVVDDVLTTGGAIRECLDLVRSTGAELVGTAVLADRSGGTVDLGCRLDALVTLYITNFPPDLCPLCRSGEPLTEPGSKYLTEKK